METVRCVRKEEDCHSKEYEKIVGESDEIKRAKDVAIKTASTNASVLITGETGTGKELFANLIRAEGERAKKPFVVVDCSAIPENLMESELFGHERGSFTDASRAKKGKFKLADGGTIFLDEIGEMPLFMQAKLLRVLENRSFYTVGGEKKEIVDVRIISATNCNLEIAVEEGRFRKDLYYRLKVIEIKIPSLKDRWSDIELISDYYFNFFKKEFGKERLDVSSEIKRYIRACLWPGNVRQLRNYIEQAVILSEEEITCDSSDRPDTSIVADLIIDPSDGFSNAVENFEKKFIISILEPFKGNVSAAGLAYGIKRTTLLEKMRRYGILSNSPGCSKEKSEDNSANKITQIKINIIKEEITKERIEELKRKLEKSYENVRRLNRQKNNLIPTIGHLQDDLDDYKKRLIDAKRLAASLKREKKAYKLKNIKQ